MKTLNEMRLLARNGQTELLTLDKAKILKGKRIQTIYFGYAGPDGTNEFVVGEIVSELEYYRNLKEDCFPNKNGNMNRAEYWESFMTPAQLEDCRNKLLLLREDGSYTCIFLGVDHSTFACTDADRFVSFIRL
jgi:hypothetical protein